MKIVVMGVSGIGIYKIRFSFSSSSLGLVEYVDVGVDMTYVRNNKQLVKPLATHGGPFREYKIYIMMVQVVARPAWAWHWLSSSASPSTTLTTTTPRRTGRR